MYGRFQGLKKLINPLHSPSELSLQMYKDVEDRNGLYYEISSNKLYTGRTEALLSKEIFYIEDFKDGKRHGKMIKSEKFHPNGKKWVFWTFKDGKEHGSIDIYSEDGELSWTEIWKNGVHLKTVKC